MPWLSRIGGTVCVGEVTAADAGLTKPLGEIQAGWLVLDVSIVILEAFTGGTPSILVGDAADADGWLAAGAVLGSVGSYKGVSATGTVYNGSAGSAFAPVGKFYSARTNIIATVSAGLVSGRALVVARAVDIGSL